MALRANPIDMHREDPLPLPWVVENPDPDLPDIPDDVLEELCAADESRYTQASASFLLWATALGDRNGQRLEAMSYDEIMLWVKVVALQLHTEWLRRGGLVEVPHGGFLPPSEPMRAKLPFDTIVIR